MLAICEDCAKKYNIDENKIKGDRARFSCQECGHIIVVEKSKAGAVPQPEETPAPVASAPESPPAASEPDGTEVTPSNEAGDSKASGGDSTPEVAADGKTEKGSQKKKAGKGLPIVSYLLFSLIIGFVSIAAAFGYLYFKYIPQLMNEQVDLRTSAITTMFSGSVKQPLLVKNYLQVNKEAERASALPGVAYAAVVNARGIVVAGFFSDLSRFDPVFSAKVKSGGFPLSILKNNALQKGMQENSTRFTIGGQKVQDRGLLLPDTGGAVHVGIYVSEIEQTINTALFSPLSLSLIGIIFLFGMLIFLIVARSISKPLLELTDVVNRISLGELDLSVTPKGPSEVRELAAAFERMRYSIKSAIERMRTMS